MLFLINLGHSLGSALPYGKVEYTCNITSNMQKLRSSALAELCTKSKL